MKQFLFQDLSGFPLLKNFKNWRELTKYFEKSTLLQKNQRTSFSRMDILAQETASPCEKPLIELWNFTQRETEILFS